MHSFICRATLSFLTVCNWYFPYRGRAKPPEPEKELSEKRADNNPQPLNMIRKLDPVPRDSLLSQASLSPVGSSESTSFASMLSAASALYISVRQPLATINVKWVIVSLFFNPGCKEPIGV
jgi:hypothetical protein